MTDQDQPPHQPTGQTPPWMQDPAGDADQGPAEPLSTRAPRGSRGIGSKGALLAGLLLVAGLAGGFFAGRATAPKGPATLAEAIQMAASGELPQGTMQAGQGRAGGAQGQPPAGFPAPNGQTGQGGPGGVAGGPGGLQGEVTAVDGDTVTIRTQAGEVKVTLTDATTVARSVTGKRSDIAIGRTISVRPDFDGGGTSAGSTVVAGAVTVQP